MSQNTLSTLEKEIDRLEGCLERIEEIVVSDLDCLENSQEEADKVADLMALYGLPFSYTKLTSDHIMIDRLLELDEELNIIAIDDEKITPIPLSYYLYSLAVELDYLESEEKDTKKGFVKYNKHLLGQ